MHRNGHKPDGPEPDREDFGFALGGVLSAFGLLALLAFIPVVKVG